MSRVRARVEGTVQGVGFRPYVYRLAAELGLAGHVLNDSRGVVVEVEAPSRDGRALPRAPAGRGAAARDGRARDRGAARRARRARLLDPRQPGRRRAARAAVTPDSATCADCLAELFDPADRRYRYPFIELHQLRPAVHDRARRPVRPAATRRWPASPCARPAAPSTRTRPTGASTPSRTPARTAGRGCGSCTRAAARSTTRGRPIRSRRPRGAAATARSSRSRASAASTSPAGPSDEDAVARAARAQAPRGQAVRADGADARGGARRWSRSSAAAEELLLLAARGRSCWRRGAPDAPRGAVGGAAARPSSA